MSTSPSLLASLGQGYLGAFPRGQLPPASRYPLQFAFQASDSGSVGALGSLFLSNGSGWLSVNPDTYAKLVKRFGPGPLLTRADRVVPYVGPGALIWVNPLGSNGSGTFNSPFNITGLLAHTFVPSTTVLLLAGTQGVLPATWQPTVSGTSPITAIVVAAYNPATGARLAGRGKFLASLVVAGTGPAVVKLNSVNYWCFDGVKLAGGAPSMNSGQMWLSGTSANNQILNGDMSDHTYAGLYVTSTGTGNVAEGNTCQRNALAGIAHPLAGVDANNSYNYNVCTDNGFYGVGVTPEVTPLAAYTGEVCGNIVERNGRSGTTFGIIVQAKKSSAKVHHNFASSQGIGVLLQGAVPGADYSSSIVESNSTSNGGWFNIEVAQITAPTKRVLVQYNVGFDAGTYDGLTAATPEAFGRGIELFSSDPANPVSGVDVCYNFMNRARNYIVAAGPGNGSEGVGYGCDDNCLDVRVFSNVGQGNEGENVQVNTNQGSTLVHHNLGIDNACSLRTDNPACQSDIRVIASPYTLVYNNTSIMFGRVNQLFGLVDSSQFPSLNSGAYNNLTVGARIAGMSKAQMAESNNLSEGVQFAVVDTATRALVPYGASTKVIALGSSGLATELMNPASGGPCDRAGVLVDASSTALDGQAQSNPPPVGCSMPALV